MARNNHPLGQTPFLFLVFAVFIFTRAHHHTSTPSHLSQYLNTLLCCTFHNATIPPLLFSRCKNNTLPFVAQLAKENPKVLCNSLTEPNIKITTLQVRASKAGSPHSIERGLAERCDFYHWHEETELRRPLGFFAA